MMKRLQWKAVSISAITQREIEAAFDQTSTSTRQLRIADWSSLRKRTPNRTSEWSIHAFSPSSSRAPTNCAANRESLEAWLMKAFKRRPRSDVSP
jgi:tRNA G10  N-methylase Trm11